MPAIEEAWRTTAGRAGFLAIAREEDEQTVRSYWSDNKYTLPVSAPGNRTYYDLFDRDSGSGVPQIYFFNEDGIMIGFSDDSRTLSSQEIIQMLGL